MDANTGVTGAVGQLLGGGLTLVVLVFAFILMLTGPAGARRAAHGATKALGAGLWHALRFTVGGVLLVVFTAIDALITATLVAYQTVTARPWLAGDTWAAFGYRLNDRVARMVWH